MVPRHEVSQGCQTRERHHRGNQTCARARGNESYGEWIPIPPKSWLLNVRQKTGDAKPSMFTQLLETASESDAVDAASISYGGERIVSYFTDLATDAVQVDPIQSVFATVRVCFHLTLEKDCLCPPHFLSRYVSLS